jgi:hypothetical protein
MSFDKFSSYRSFGGPTGDQRWVAGEARWRWSRLNGGLQEGGGRGQRAAEEGGGRSLMTSRACLVEKKTPGHTLVRAHDRSHVRTPPSKNLRRDRSGARALNYSIKQEKGGG